MGSFCLCDNYCPIINLTDAREECTLLSSIFEYKISTGGSLPHFRSGLPTVFVSSSAFRSLQVTSDCKGDEHAA